MSTRATKDLFVEYFACQKLDSELYNRVLLPYNAKYKNGQLTREAVYEEFQPLEQLLAKLTFSRPDFDALLNEAIGEVVAGGKPSRKLDRFVKAHSERIEAQISGTPKAFSKAYDCLRALIDLDAYDDTDQVYDAMVLLDDEVSPEIIERVVRRWKDEYRKHKASEHLEMDASEQFWVSADFHEIEDALSRYRFRDRFAIGEFEPTFREVESALTAMLVDGYEMPTVQWVGAYCPGHLRGMAFNLWRMSRCRSLIDRLWEPVSMALRQIGAWQGHEGWWPNDPLRELLGQDPHTGRDKWAVPASVFLTALCSLLLVKLEASDTLKEKGILAAGWLVQQQNPDGSWPEESPATDGKPPEPGLVATMLAVEAILRSGIGNVDHTVELALRWIESQQGELGMWEESGWPLPLLTVLVLELRELASALSARPDLSPYLTMCKGFLEKAARMLGEDEGNSRRLAVVAGFQAIEAFLYALLSDQSINIRIYESNGQTIGMRAALVRFQEHLQQKKQLRPGSVVPYRNSLDALAYYRDQVVHKGIDVPYDTAYPLIQDAVRFTAKYSAQVLGFDLWA